MKNLLYLILIVVLTSCTKDKILVRVCKTGEKLELVSSIYEKGDTVVLKQYVDSKKDELKFKIDHNWISFPGYMICLEEDCYYKSVVIHKY